MLPFEEAAPELFPTVPPTLPVADEIPKALSPRPAGFLRRVIAFFLDLMVIGGLYLVVVTVGILSLRRAAGEAASLSTVGAFSVIVVPFIAAWFSLFIGYFSFFHGNGGQTPGKRLIRIKVITSDGIPLSPVRSFLRSFGYFLS
ncbi:MAG: RDD family protein, partial [Candidatus Manganitrophaceae bacterium]